MKDFTPFVVTIDGRPVYIKRKPEGFIQSHYWHADNKWVTWYLMTEEQVDFLYPLRSPDYEADMYHALHKKTMNYPPDHFGNP